MAAVSPKLKDLPKVSDDLKTQLEGFDHDKMKHADTQEKIVLPTAAGKTEFYLVSFYDCFLAVRNGFGFIVGIFFPSISQSSQKINLPFKFDYLLATFYKT